MFKQLIWLLAFTSVFSVDCVCGSAGQTNCVVRRLEYFKCLNTRVHKSYVFSRCMWKARSVNVGACVQWWEWLSNELFGQLYGLCPDAGVPGIAAV